MRTNARVLRTIAQILGRFGRFWCIFAQFLGRQLCAVWPQNLAEWRRCCVGIGGGEAGSGKEAGSVAGTYRYRAAEQTSWAMREEGAAPPYPRHLPAKVRKNTYLGDFLPLIASGIAEPGSGFPGIDSFWEASGTIVGLRKRSGVGQSTGSDSVRSESFAERTLRF